MITQNKRLTAILFSVPLLLLIPLVAMQFSAEVNWALPDFLIAGLLLLATGLTIEFVLRKVTHPRHRVLLCLGIVLVLFLVWAELAVGIFGTPFAGS